jgi:hypothetical protein
MNETMISVLDYVSNCHATRLARGRSYGRREGVETEPDSAGRLLQEFSGWRRETTFQEQLDAWLKEEFDLDGDSRRELIAWVISQPLPIAQIESILTDAGISLADLATALAGILTYCYLLTGELPADAVTPTMIAAGIEDDNLRPAVAAWCEFQAQVFLMTAKREAAKNGN